MGTDLKHCPTLLQTLAILSVLSGVSAASVVDRIALVVGKTVFTQSEVDDEARLSEIESGKPLDLSAVQRKAAAERLVDQQLLRDEMTASGFQAPQVDGNALLRGFRQEHFSSPALYSAALTHYGVTEDALKQHLAWQVTLLRFTDQRFKPLIDTDDQAANRVDGKSAQPVADTVDQEMEAWLKQQRTNTRVVFKTEAFE